jgi:Cu/Ag efflux pump CusA
MPIIVMPQKGEGIDYKGMAIVLAGGLTTSTFFTIFVVPLFYTLLDDLRRAAMTLLHRPELGLRQAASPPPHEA